MMNIINPTFAYDELRRSRLPPAPRLCRDMIGGDPFSFGLVAHYNPIGNVSAGGTIPDLSGNGHNAALVNSSFVDSNGAYLNGTADYITIPYSSELYPASTVSVKMWIASEDWSTVKTFFSNTQTGGYGARINHDTDEIYFLARLNGTYCTATCTYSTLNLSGSNHFAGTCDGRYVKLYINGELVATADAGAYYEITYTYNLPLLIGAEPDASGAPTDSYGYSKGYHNDIRIYNRAVPAAEIAAYVNYTKGTHQ